MLVPMLVFLIVTKVFLGPSADVSQVPRSIFLIIMAGISLSPSHSNASGH